MNDSNETLHFLDYWRVVSSRKEIVLAISLLVVLTGVVVTLSMRKVYMASAVIRVKEEAPDVSVFNPEIMRYDPLFLRTQFEIIQSRPVIEEVVRRRELTQKFSKAYGYEHLSPSKQLDQTCKIVSKLMKVQQYRDTNLIEIQMFFAEPKEDAPHEAAMAANVVAEVFRAQTAARSRKSMESALDALYEAFQEQDKRVTKAEEHVEKIRTDYEIDTIDSYSGSRGSLDKMRLMNLEELRVRVRQEQADADSRYTLIMGLSPDDLLAAAPYLLKDVITSQLVAQKRASQVRLSQLQESYGPRHPDVISVRAALTELDKKIADALNGLKIGAKANHQAATAKLVIVEDELNKLREVERQDESGPYRMFARATQDLEHARRIRDRLEGRWLQEQIELSIPRTTVELLEEAKAADEKDYVSPKLLLNIILSIIVGLGAGVGLAYFAEYLDTSVKTIEDIEKVMGVPVLGVIPQKVRPLSEEGVNAAHAESYRVLRTNIQFAEGFKDGKTICFTSGSMGEGKSLTMFNLAYVCSQLGDRVLVIDSDLHRPRQHRMMGVSNKVGLAQVLIEESSFSDMVVRDVFPGLDFLPSGKMDSGVHGLLDTQRVRGLINEVRDQYDIVFLDAPPVIGVSDASVLAREVDGVMLLIQHRKYPRAISVRAKGMLDNMSANLIGAILNNINISRDQSYYYYHQYYYQSDYTKTPNKAA